MVFVAAWKQGSPLFLVGAAAAVWGIVITATYFFRALRSTFYGEPRDMPAAPRPGAAAIAAIAILVIASVALGIWPRLVTDGLKSDGSITRTMGSGGVR
jgi:NADH:ubiquinone oxidoreductase subunit 4 (subunit M)